MACKHDMDTCMNLLVKFMEEIGMDPLDLDEFVGEYVVQLAQGGGTEQEVWDVLEGVFPDLGQSAKAKQIFPGLVTELQRPEDASAAPAAEDRVASARIADESSTDPNSANNEEDVTFLREIVPSMSDRGLRYVLHHVYKGNYEAAATYLLDECGGGKGAGNARSALEGRAEAFDMREREEKRKEETARMRAEQEKKETERELEVLKKQIVGRYADEAEGAAPVVNVVPALDSKKQTTRYRESRVVTTTGAKVIVESLKPEWDGGSRGRVKTKGKRGKGFV